MEVIASQSVRISQAISIILDFFSFDGLKSRKCINEIFHFLEVNENSFYNIYI